MAEKMRKERDSLGEVEVPEEFPDPEPVSRSTASGLGPDHLGGDQVLTRLDICCYIELCRQSGSLAVPDFLTINPQIKS